MHTVVFDAAIPQGKTSKLTCDYAIQDGADSGRLMVLMPTGWWETGAAEPQRTSVLSLALAGLPAAAVAHRALDGRQRLGGVDLAKDAAGGCTEAFEQHKFRCGDSHGMILVGRDGGALVALATAQRLINQNVPVGGLILENCPANLDPSDETLKRPLSRYVQDGGDALTPEALLKDLDLPVAFIGEVTSAFKVLPRATHLAKVNGSLCDGPDPDTIAAAQKWVLGLGAGDEDDLMVGEPAFLQS